MKLDERLERLTHTVELQAQMRIDDGSMRTAFTVSLDVIEKLAQIAESHERRVDGLEGQRS